MGWTAQYFTTIIIEGNAPNAGVFIYVGQALVGSFTASAGVDQFGNSYPAGINVSAGSLTGVNIANASIVASTIINTLIQGASIVTSNMTGGTITETAITFDSRGGQLLCYTATTTTTTLTPANTSYTPAVSGSYSITCWGADAGGGGGGTTFGGFAGGGGEMANEPAVPLIGGTSYPVFVGTAGQGGSTGFGGTDGGSTNFNNVIFANGGKAAFNGVGLGGTGSTNTNHQNGGNGGSNVPNFTSSAGGGGRAGTTGPGGNGGNPTSNAVPGTAGAAGTGTGGLAGGAGVLTGTNGNNGGGGSGAGSNAGTTQQSIFYDPTSTFSFYGAGVGGGQRNKNGSMYQGDPNVPVNQFPGDQESFANYNSTKMANDWAGWTIDSVQLTINNQHSWYNSGCYAVVGVAISSVNHFNQKAFWTPQGVTTGPVDISGIANLKTAIAAGTFQALILGPSSSTSGGSLDLYNYGVYQGGAGQGGPRITVKGHQGSVPVAGGNGSDGQIQVTFSTSSVLLCSVSPIAASDSSSNAYAAGFTGPIQAFHPGSSPTTVEGWQNVTPPTGWSGTLRYKRLAELNRVEIDYALTHTALTVLTNIPLMTLTLSPNYRPATAVTLPCVVSNNTANSTPAPSTFVGTGGVTTAFNIPVGTTGIDCHASFALD
jgi:hypothetical protein